MKLETRIQLVLMSQSSWYLVHGLILPVCKNPKTHIENLAMADLDIGIKNTIESYSHVANISNITNIPIKHANDAGITVISFEKKCKPCELQLAFLDASDLANDWDSFRNSQGMSFDP